MKIFLILFLSAIKTAGSAQKLRVGRDSVKHGYFFYLRLTSENVYTVMYMDFVCNLFKADAQRRI